MLLKVLKGYEKKLGKKHPDTLWALSVFGRALASQSRYEEAEPFYQ
jgi:hypothetical protein